jgi:hypothetical protein
MGLDARVLSISRLSACVGYLAAANIKFSTLLPQTANTVLRVFQVEDILTVLQCRMSDSGNLCSYYCR